MSGSRWVALARYYDPATGQFLSRDPLVAVTGSAYGYVDDNPLNGTDPTGLLCFHNPFGNDNCQSIWKQHPAIQKPLIAAVAAPLAVACVAGGCEAAAALAGTYAAAASNVATGLADLDVAYNCATLGFNSRACQVGLLTAGTATFLSFLPALAAKLPSVVFTEADQQIGALIQLIGSAISGWLSNQMQCPGKPG